MTASISARLIENILEAAVRADVVTEHHASALRRELACPADGPGITERAGEDILMVLWSRLADAAGDHSVGLRVAAHAQLHTFGLVGEAVRFAANFTQAVGSVVKFSRLMHSGVRFVVTETDRRVVVTYRMESDHLVAGHGGPAAGMLWALGNVAWIPHRAFGRAISPISSSLICDPPRDPAVTAVFGDNVTFGASATELVYDRADVGTLIRNSAPPPVVEYVDYLANSELGKLPAPDDIVAAVSNVLAHNLADGPPDIAFVARVLTMSVRTLQRRLREHQVTYGAVLDSVRRDRARDMLERGGISMGDIARALGYSEQAVFSRATRRWFGAAPTSVGRPRRLPGASD